MPNEKGGSQDDAAEFLNRIGWGIKVDTEAVSYSGEVMYPKHAGAPDYIAVVRTGHVPLPIAVEVKGEPTHRWLMSSWPLGQRNWTEAWGKRIGCEVLRFLWLQIGPNRVDSTEVHLRRSTWLIPQAIVLEAERLLLSTGVKGLPMNAQARHKGTDDFTQELHAEALFQGYKMSWIPRFGWWPDRNSQIWKMLRTEPYEYTTAVEFNARNPHPDSVGNPEGSSGGGSKPAAARPNRYNRSGYSPRRSG